MGITLLSPVPPFMRLRVTVIWRCSTKTSSLLTGGVLRPRFSLFGVGDYSFASWKVAISGFYRRLDFRVLEPLHDKPVVLDDTCYFIPCRTRAECIYLASHLNSRIARDFPSALIFWDAKRPITLALLRRLDLLALAKELHSADTLQRYLRRLEKDTRQSSLFPIR